MKKRIASIIALVLAALMLLGLLASITSPYIYAVTSEDLNEQLSNLQADQQRLEKRLTEIEDKRDAELEKKDLIDQQINAIQQQVNLEQQKLDVLDDELAQANEKLDAATEAYDEAYEASKDRIRAAYENGNVSYLQIVLASKSVSDFIMRLEIVSEIMAYDKAVLKQLTDSKAEIEASQKTIADRQKQQQEATDSLKQQRSSLAGKKNASDRLLSSIEARSDDLSSQIAEIEAQKDQLRAEIQKKIKDENSSGNFGNLVVSGDFMYPLDSKWRIITSPFGYRKHPTTGVYKLHSGCDISGSGIYGVPIYASKNGKVTTAGHHSAYGNYVVINHGDGTATLYAHMSSLATFTGASVKQGQVIGYVGSSGYSTGAHLHFEILVNGEYVDPVPYFSSKINFTYY